MAAVIGGGGSFAIAAPGQAAIPCSLSYTVAPWRDPAAPYYYIVSAWIKNTGQVTSTNWVVYISFPSGTTTELYWNAQPMPEYGDGWYTAAAWNKAIPPGQEANFGFKVTTPPGVVGTPTVFVCSI